MTAGIQRQGSVRQNHSSVPEYIRLFFATLRRYLQQVPSVKEDTEQKSYMNSGLRDRGVDKGGKDDAAMTIRPTRPRLIAFYLPQFHPIPENDAWWGEGFTEWTHVQRAKPLFTGHVQPKIPSDLGCYSLLDGRVRESQARLAAEAGIEGFCYWHYWFGNGKRLLEQPFQEVLESGNPGYPFCLAWANESWTGVWHGMKDHILMRQEYTGVEDYRDHFSCLEKAFLDPRYIRVNGNPLFVVYKPWELPDAAEFTRLWRQLAAERGLNGLYFMGISDTPLPPEFGFDGFMSGQPLIPERTVFPTFAEILVYRLFRLHLRRFRRIEPEGLNVFPYRSFVRHSLNRPLQDGEFPVVVPNWDNTPRVGRRGTVLQDSTPELFSVLLRKAIALAESRPAEEQLIFIKSWNEWAEGNYLEPDAQFGSSYLDAVAGVMGRRT